MKKKPAKKPVAAAKKPKIDKPSKPEPAKQPQQPTQPARPAAPKMFSYELNQALVASWYEQGMRHAGAKVNQHSWIWNETQESWLQEMEIILYPALETKRSVKLLGSHDRWLGPRETYYELREPNAKEKISIELIFSCAEAASNQPKPQRGPKPKPLKPEPPKQVAKQQPAKESGKPAKETRPEQPKRKKAVASKDGTPKVTGIAAKILALLQRKGGATMEQLSEISTTSQRSSMSILRMKGFNITITKRSDGKRVYEVKP